MSRVYNFSAGPAVLPEEVLREAAEEMLDYQGTGMSVMEMSHRSKMFENILEQAKADLKELMHIPDNYKILFLQGECAKPVPKRFCAKKRERTSGLSEKPDCETHPKSLHFLRCRGKMPAFGSCRHTLTY